MPRWRRGRRWNRGRNRRGPCSVGDLLRAVALGKHDHAAAVALEEINVGVHAAGCGGTHGAAGHAGGRFGGTGVVDGVILEILGHVFAAVEGVP